MLSTYVSGNIKKEEIDENQCKELKKSWDLFAGDGSGFNKNISEQDKKNVDKLLRLQGGPPIFESSNAGYNIRHALGEKGEIETTQGKPDGDYVSFPIKTELFGHYEKNSTIIKIHTDLLNNISETIYNRNIYLLNIPLLWDKANPRDKKSRLKQPIYIPQPAKWGENYKPLKNLLFPNIKNIRYKKIQFKDGNRLHWSNSNIVILKKSEYNKKKKSNVVVLDEWTPFNN